MEWHEGGSSSMLFAENFYTLLAFFFIFLLSRGHKRSSMAMLYLLLFPGFYRHNSYTPNQPCLYLKNLLNATIFLLCLPFNHGDAISILCYKKTHNSIAYFCGNAFLARLFVEFFIYLLLF